MANVAEMNWSKVYSMLIKKAERKERTKAEVDQATSWLTGYTVEELDSFWDTDLTYGEFFDRAPKMNPKRVLIKGKICGVQVDAIEDPLMKAVRQLDKLVDEIAKGRPMEKILREPKNEAERLEVENVND